METKVLTQEELNSLTELRQLQNSALNELGSIEYKITLLENSKTNLKNHVVELEKRSVELGVQLSEKYGNGTLNLETGEITVE
jgi:hypothetical protein